MKTLAPTTFKFDFHSNRDVIDNKTTTTTTLSTPPSSNNSSPTLLTPISLSPESSPESSPLPSPLLLSPLSPPSLLLLQPPPPTSPQSLRTPPSMSNDFHREDARLNSFTNNWPHQYLNVTRLAKIGFYFIGPHDTVKCYFCSVEIGRWEPEDNELTEHIRWSQNCPLLKRRETNNEPIDVNELDRILPPVSYDVCGPFSGIVDIRPGAYSESSISTSITSSISRTSSSESSASASMLPQRQQQQQRSRSSLSPPSSSSSSSSSSSASSTTHQLSFDSNVERATKFPDNPQYAIESQRLHSFDDWPKTMKQKPNALSDAGFYYTQTGDRVKCFSCGGGLRDWDEYDIPWEQHAIWFDQCEYLKLVKGQEYIDSVKNRHKQLEEEEENNNNNNNNNVQEEQEYNNNNNNDNVSSTNNKNSDCYNKRNSASTSTSCGGVTSKPSTSASALASSPSTSLNDDDNNSMEKKVRDERLCRICYVQEYNTIFHPCGHVVACAKCASSVNKCPMCRKPFNLIMKVFFP